MKIELTSHQKEKLTACIVGCAVGDAVGLPFEGIKPQKISCLLGEKRVRHCLIAHYGMWSDDTDHSIMLIQSLLETSSEKSFTKCFRSKLRLWFLTLPPGVGIGTARAIFKSFLGFKNTGVFSAGNGPCMRAAAVGIVYYNNVEKRKAFNSLQTQVTHVDPKAQIASRAIVELTAYLFQNTEPLTVEDLQSITTVETDVEWSMLVDQMVTALNNKETPSEYVSTYLKGSLKGVSGYAYHTVPAVVYTCFYFNFDFEKTVTSLIHLGGDTDTSCAIAGALCGIAHGVEAIPEEWKSNIKEYPIKFSTLSRIGSQSLFKKRDMPFRLVRNFFQLLVVLVHGFGRLLPTFITKQFY